MNDVVEVEAPSPPVVGVWTLAWYVWLEDAWVFMIFAPQFVG